MHVDNSAFCIAFRIVKLAQAEINGESTFGMKENEAEPKDLVELQVKSATKVLKNLLSDSGSSFVDLLHVNCEVNLPSTISTISIQYIALALSITFPYLCIYTGL